MYLETIQTLRRKSWQWLKDQIAQDVPDADGLCEYDCRKEQCAEEEWATCERRIHKAAGELWPESSPAPRPVAQSDPSPMFVSESAVKWVAAVSEIENAREMLTQKELDCVRVAKEVEALRIVAPLLRDEEDWVRETARPTLTATGQSLLEAEAIVESPPASSSGRGRWRDRPLSA